MALKRKRIIKDNIVPELILDGDSDAHVSENRIFPIILTVKKMMIQTTHGGLTVCGLDITNIFFYPQIYKGFM
jgi:hypothetical protein